jgi:2-methylisocitrate lyase-like PEP mutase family enzyme
MTLDDKCRVLRTLHAEGCFVVPNPWDPGSAVLLEQLGFRALATTSSGFAWSIGRADNHVTLDEALAHYRAMSGAVRVPVSADFEGAFAIEPDEVAANVMAASATGLAGLSIEDSSKNRAAPLFDFDLAVERVRAARGAIDEGPAPLVLTARSEGFIVGRPDLEETIRRLIAFAGAGADCVFAPGIHDEDHIRAIVAAVAPTPVNVLVSSDFTTVSPGGAWGAPDQRRGRARPRRVGRIPAGRDRNRDGRHLHRTDAWSAVASVQPAVRVVRWIFASVATCPA